MKTFNTYIPYGGGAQIPDRIVVHAMAEYFPNSGSPQHAVAFLNDYELSAHVLVAPNGDKFICRSDEEIAWHASGYNENSLGIEFLVQGVHTYESFLNRIKEPYITDAQMKIGVEVMQSWVTLHDIKSTDRHSTLSPDRKVDPGIGFPWDYFSKLILL